MDERAGEKRTGETPPAGGGGLGGQPMTLRQWRGRRALGTAELAARAGVSKVTVIAIEHGRVTAIKRRTIRRLSEALGVDPWDVAEFRRALSGEG
jgi:DNA-binding Xre family transcriptional regulator